MNSINWLPIPDAPLYEISNRGVVRNINTGKTISVYECCRGKYVTLHVDGVSCKRSISNLLWLTHGISRRKRGFVVPVIVSKGNTVRYFDSCKQAAEFISRREDKTLETVKVYLSRRHGEIHGWKINYQR